MDINLIKNYVIKSNIYTRELEGYFIPTFIKESDGFEIPLYNNIKQALVKNSSPYSRDFENSIDRSLRYTKYIKEFPIIIENKELWSNILFCLNLENNSNNSYFLLDYFFPHLGFCVEIDSSYHDSRELYDKARDLYVYKEYGIETLRFYKYSSNSTEYNELFNKTINSKLKLFRNSSLITLRQIPIDYSNTIMNNFIQKNRQALEFIDNLVNYLGPWKFYINNTIKLSHLELGRIDCFTFNKNILSNPLIKGSPEQLLLDGIVLLLKQIYNKDLIIV